MGSVPLKKNWTENLFLIAKKNNISLSTRRKKFEYVI